MLKHYGSPKTSTPTSIHKIIKMSMHQKTAHNGVNGKPSTTSDKHH